MPRLLLCIAAAALALDAPEAHAGCCRLAKVDAETPAVPVRACQPDADGLCASVLYEGPLDLGATRDVCVTGSTLVYAEWDNEADAFAALVEAVCDGRDVEL